MIDRIYRLIDVPRMRFLKRTLPPPTSQELELAEELRHKVSLLEVDVDPSLPPTQLAWNRNMLRLKQHVLTSDPRDFLSWDIIRGTMFVKYAKYSRTEYRYLRKSGKWQRWKDAIREDRAGNPVPCPFDTATSCNLVHHAYHLARWEDAFGQDVQSHQLVVEFGGGYGSMCRLFHHLGFSGRYIIIDLPAFTALQEYFLKSIGLRVLNRDEFASGLNGILCISDIDQLAYLIDRSNKKLLVATWSLSETPLPLRQRLLGYTDGFDSYLIAYQVRFEDIDNEDYFSKWRAKKTDYEWTCPSIEQIRNQKYLFGIRKG